MNVPSRPGSARKRTGFYWAGLALIVLKSISVLTLLHRHPPGSPIWLVGKTAPTLVGVLFLIDAILTRSKGGIVLWGIITLAAIALTIAVLSPWWPYGSLY